MNSPTAISGWPPRPRPATANQYAAYLLARALRTQGLVSLDSICYGELKWKAAVRTVIEAGVRRKQLVPVHLEGFEKLQHWPKRRRWTSQLIPLPPSPICCRPSIHW